MNRFLLIFSLVTLTSCSSFFDGLHHMFYPSCWNRVYNDCSQIDEPTPDEITLQNNDGSLTGIPPQPNTRKIFLNKPYEDYIIKNGEIVQLQIDNLNINTVNIDLVPDENTGDILIRIRPKIKDTIVFQNKCQTFFRYSTDIPNVKVADGLKFEQIVYTPIFDKNCNHIGWNLRYGSIERGCNSKAIKEIVQKFINCTGQTVKKSIPCKDCPPIPRKFGLCNCK